MTKLLIYTTEKCPACRAMKSALKTLGVQYTDIKLKTGMLLPPDVRSVPTLASETDGRRTTVCIGWPGSLEKLKRLLRKKGTWETGI